jgi:hypothetical protein
LYGTKPVNHILKTGRAAGFAVLGILISSSAFAQIPSTSNTTGLWKTVTTSGGQSMTDPFIDQQTGTTEGDLVGNAANPLLFAHFNPGTAGSLTDGTIYFRVRVGRDASPAVFKSSILLGIDANGNGGIDLFVGVDNSGNPNVLHIWDRGG